MLNRKLKLSPYVIKKFEENLEKFCFYNAKDKTFWNADFALGTTISALDGSLTVLEVIEILSLNNPQINNDEFKESLLEVLNSLLEEGFLVESM